MKFIIFDIKKGWTNQKNTSKHINICTKDKNYLLYYVKMISPRFNFFFQTRTWLNTFLSFPNTYDRHKLNNFSFEVEKKIIIADFLQVIVANFSPQKMIFQKSS